MPPYYTCPICGTAGAYSVMMKQCEKCGITDEAIYRFRLTTRKGRLVFSRSRYVRKSSWNRKRNKHARIGVVRNVKDASYDKSGGPRPKRLHRANAHALSGGRAGLKSHPATLRQRGAQSVGQKGW